MPGKNPGDPVLTENLPDVMSEHDPKERLASSDTIRIGTPIVRSTFTSP
jgi:hypothetical protein